MEGGIFLYEYATCGSIDEIPPPIALEGLGMFKALEQGFSSHHKVSTFVDPCLNFFPDYPRISFSHDVFLNYLENSDECLLIAPESENILYRLTDILEDTDCANLGSTSKGVKETTDKYATYKRLGDLSPKTEIFEGTTRLSFPLVAKPRDGVSGEGIFLVKNEKELAGVPNGYLLQEYIPGKPMSAGFIIGDETTLLSLHTQELQGFTYKGAKLPVEGIDPEPLFQAVEKIKGLHGYVGVDFILGSEIKVIEINPRPTTPIVAFKRALGVNLGDVLLRNYQGRPLPKPSRKTPTQIIKLRGNVKDSFISFRGYCMVMRDWNADYHLGHRRGQH